MGILRICGVCRRHCRPDRVTLMTGLGDVILHRRDAGGAADARLATAEASGTSIGSTYGNAAKSRNEHDFWRRRERSSVLCWSDAGGAPKHYAKLNGATVDILFGGEARYCDSFSPYGFCDRFTDERMTSALSCLR